MKRLSLAVLTLLACTGAQAASEEVEMNLVTSQGVGQSIGTVKITETDKGLEFAPDLKALPPGDHGFHVHAKGRTVRPRRLKQRVDTSIRTPRVNMKGQRAQAIRGICRCFRSITTVKPPSLWFPRV